MITNGCLHDSTFGLCAAARRAKSPPGPSFAAVLAGTAKSATQSPVRAFALPSVAVRQQRRLVQRWRVFVARIFFNADPIL